MEPEIKSFWILLITLALMIVIIMYIRPAHALDIYTLVSYTVKVDGKKATQGTKELEVKCNEDQSECEINL